MSDPVEAPGEPPVAAGLLGPLDRALRLVNRVVLTVGMVALVASALVLTYSVFSRYFFKAATDWQDEAAVFLLVGAAFALPFNTLLFGIENLIFLLFPQRVVAVSPGDLQGFDGIEVLPLTG